MTARDKILGKLRNAQQPFTEVKPITDRRRMIPGRDLSPEEQLEQFIAEAKALGSYVYKVTPNEALEQIMDLVGNDKSVLSWDESHLPLEGLHGMLGSLNVKVAPHNDGDVRVGITGVSSALAATGSLIVESGDRAISEYLTVAGCAYRADARRADLARSGKLAAGR